MGKLIPIRRRLEAHGFVPRGTEAALVTKRGKLELAWAVDMKPQLKSGGTLVKGLLDCGAMSVIYGPSNSGKSFFCLDLAAHVALGRSWRSRKIKTPGAVVYVAAEGGMGFINRVAAMKQHLGVGEADAFPLAVIASPINLLDPKAHLPEILTLIRETGDAIGLPVVMVVIDTLSRAMAGGDENAPKDMTAFVANCDAIRQAEPHPHVAIVHHTGKDLARGARGHNSLLGATDTEAEITKERIDDASDKRATARITKQRDMPGGEAFKFDLWSVHLGDDEDGDPVTSAVVNVGWPGDLIKATTDEKSDPKETKEFTAFVLLTNMLTIGGECVAETGAPIDQRVVSIAAWRDAMIETGILGGRSDEARRKAFERIRDTLSGKGSIRMAGKYVWPAGSEQ